MKKLMKLAAVASLLFMCSCAYTNIRIPLDTNLENTTLGSKQGTASNYGLFWLVAWGDASYAKAAQNGGITVMKHADEEYQVYFFGTFAKQTTIVYGD